jgi:hypothetical protein
LKGDLSRNKIESTFIVEEILIEGDRDSAEVEVMLDKINSSWTY